MVNNFDDYIKQLETLENLENVTSLKTILDMHFNVLSFFPVIQDSLERVIKSGAVPSDIIEDIKSLMPVISRCKSSHEELAETEKSELYASKISRLLDKKNYVAIHEIIQYNEELSNMIDDNTKQLNKEASIKENEKAEALRRTLEEIERRRQAEVARQALQNSAKEKRILHVEREFLLSNGNISVEDACFLAENSKNRVILGRVRLKFAGNSRVVSLLGRNPYAPSSAAGGCLHMILILIIPSSILLSLLFKLI